MTEYPDEAPTTRLRRLRMRSWRRGMKEMDLILGSFADGPLSTLPSEYLDLYEAVLTQNDQDLYLWITARVNESDGGRGEPELSQMLDVIAAHARTRLQPDQ